MLRKTISNASLQRKCCLSLSSEPRLPFRLSQVEGEPGSAAIAAEGVWDGKKIPNASMVNPHVIFPWRHDTELLPRLVVGSDEFKLHGGYYGPGDPFNCPIRNMPLFTTFAANLIGVPWYKIPFSGWRQELADSSSWAFTQAVAAMMSNLYRVPFGDIRREEGDIEVDFKHTITTSNTDTEKSVNESETFSSPDLEYMVEEKLRNLYKNAHASGRDQIQIHLQMQTTSVRLLSLMMIPLFTRKESKQQPSTTVPVTKWLMEVASTPPSECVAKVQSKLHRYDGYVAYEHTIIAQVLVYCDEVFSVTDLSSGSVLQGYGDGKVRNVPHVVRLETVVEHQLQLEKRETKVVIKGWQITDWDDMLGGNVWFS